MVFLITPIARFFESTFLITWDALLELLNLVLPKRKEGHVIQKGQVGFGGQWPEYIAPQGDSRCCCPGLNTLANHGIIPRNGRNIPFKELNEKLRTACNFAPSFCRYTTKYLATMLNKNWGSDTLDLEEISLHNGIEHDGSLTRLDYAFDKDQGKPHLPYVRDLLDYASGKDKQGNVLLTGKDLSRCCAKRRAVSRASNPEYSLDFGHKVFSCTNNCVLLTIYGGRKKDLEIILTEERLPEGWEPRVRKPFGLTMAALNALAIPVELNTDEKAAAKELALNGQSTQDQTE
ncbi:hypothetical protein APHAL10511_007306 [Amanita phalloides]|nr:hypothetical protein APHAL10511_007306 [Amanita phalloides]